jgi:uroporphyrinogen decarboxylase
LLPSLDRQAEAVKSLGMSAFFHCDGNINEVLADLAKTCLDGLQGLESAAGMDIALIKREYGERVCLWGNMDPAHLQASSSPDEIAARIDAIWRATRQGHGLILGTSSGLIPGIRPENLHAIRDRLALISSGS